MRIAVVLAGAALIMAVLGAGYLLLADTYSGQDCTATPNGISECVDHSSTLIEENGRWVLALLAVPVALAAVTALAIQRRWPKSLEWGLAGLLLAGCLIAAASIGIFFLPVAALLLAATAADSRTRAAAR